MAERRAPPSASTRPATLPPAFAISIGGASAALKYYDLAPGYVGPYQFNVEVPQIADNTLAPVTFSLGSVPETQTLYTAVQQ